MAGIPKGLLDILTKKRFFRGTPASENAGAGKYFTGDPSYSYIQNSEFVMPATLGIKNPYIAKTQREIERIGAHPEIVDELKEAGYDSMVWVNPNKPTKGASGWGNDYSQIFVFDEGMVKPMPNMSDPSIIKSGAIPTAGAGALGQILFSEDDQPSSDSMSADELLKQLQGMK